ncbi:hypothetical protein GCM10010840_09300 [Deinococcus aerolatus]|uniref:Uncharacterized protein n=1 Tax=Deinococcus aerolatus TaxID=522487 RepID=A0ABQ2G4C2_9DEIO|nr:hypothetical protein [Deinococcus aerolatus]GGL73385.1 hypothetical protein GCM10010840_09300 [Deinococcus aerolatus]
MKALLLSAVMLLPLASAQRATPAASAPVLSLSAPVGTQVEYQTTTSRTAVSNVQVTALPGSDTSAEELADIKRNLSAGTAGAGNVTVKEKLFYRVTGQDAGGNVTLVSSVVQSVPGQPPMTFRITQTVARDGAVSGLKFESDNAALNAAFAGLDGQKLQELASQSNASLAGVYGRPLVQGQPRPQTATLDVTGLLSGLLGAFASQADLPQLFGQIQSTPLRVTTITTYGGPNAQGLHTFTQSSKYDRWQVKLGGSGALPAMNIELAGGGASGTQTYRKDGLPGPPTQKTQQTMNMTVVMNGVQVALTMTINQSVTAAMR